MLHTMLHLVQAWEIMWEGLLWFSLEIGPVSFIVGKSSTGVLRNLQGTIQSVAISLQIQIWSFHITILHIPFHPLQLTQSTVSLITWHPSHHFCLLFQLLGHCTSPFRWWHEGHWTEGRRDPRLGKYIQNHQMRTLKKSRERKRRSWTQYIFSSNKLYSTHLINFSRTQLDWEWIRRHNVGLHT